MHHGTHRNHSNSGPPAAEPDLDWDALAPRVVEALRQPLDPGLVAQRPGRGGRRLSYLEGHTVIEQANRVFGYGGWGYELVGEVGRREFESADPRSGELRRSSAYTAVVRVTVPGAPARTDVGFQPVADETAEGHETAYKGAVTDALKRALRSFGDRFGNGLYGDPPTAKRSHGEPAPQPQRPDERDAGIMRRQLLELSLEQGFSEQQVRIAVRRKTGRELDALGPAELQPLIASAAEKLQRIQDRRSG